MTVVPNGNASLVVTIDLVLLDLREAGAGADDATSLVFVDLIVGDVVAAVEDYYTITVVKDVVVLDPAEACFDCEESL